MALSRLLFAELGASEVNVAPCPSPLLVATRDPPIALDTVGSTVQAESMPMLFSSKAMIE